MFLSVKKSLSILIGLKNLILKSNIFFWYLIIFFALLKLILINGQSLVALGGAMHDDALFIKMASNILDSKWLGSFDNLTLAKGPGYPIWIAFNNVTGLPLLLSQNIFYIFACFILVLSLRPFFVKKQYYLILLFIFLLFNPSSFASDVSARVMREGIYSSISLIVIALSIGILVRRRESVKVLFSWSLFLGLALSFFWLTREEGVWILPFVIPILFFVAFKNWKEKKYQYKIKLLLLTLPFFILGLSVFIVSSINYYKYGVFSVVEFKDPAFLGAYGSLTRVKDMNKSRYIPVSKSSRLSIYKVSPAFRELEPFLEGDIGRGWSVHAPQAMRSEINYEYEIWGGWFMWAFRDAVSSAGHYKNAVEAKKYYEQLSEEINQACKNNELDCFPGRSTMLDPIETIRIAPFLDSFYSAVHYMAHFKGINAVSQKSSGDKQSLFLFSEITNEPVLFQEGESDKNTITFNGWVFSGSSSLTFSVLGENKEKENFSIEFSDSPDVYSFFANKGEFFEHAKRSRFEIKTDCIKDCFLAVSSSNNFNKEIPIVNNASFSNEEASIFAHIENISSKNTNLESRRKNIDNFKTGLLNKISKVYSFFMPLMIVLSLFIFLVTTLIFRRKDFLNIVIFSLLMAILARITILSLIDSTSFFAINNYYLSPVYPIVIIFVFLNIFSLTRIFSKNSKGE